MSAIKEQESDKEGKSDKKIEDDSEIKIQYFQSDAVSILAKALMERQVKSICQIRNLQDE